MIHSKNNKLPQFSKLPNKIKFKKLINFHNNNNKLLKKFKIIYKKLSKSKKMRIVHLTQFNNNNKYQNLNLIFLHNLNLFNN